MFREKKGLCSILYSFFPHLPSSYCESQYDLSEGVRGKWADHCQLLYPKGGWGSTRMSEDFSLYMKVAVNVAHHCFAKGRWILLLLLLFHYISNPNKTSNEHSTYGKQIILPEGLVWWREQITLELKTQQSALEIASEYVLYGIEHSIWSEIV